MKRKTLQINLNSFILEKKENIMIVLLTEEEIEHLLKLLDNAENFHEIDEDIYNALILAREDNENLYE